MLYCEQFKSSKTSQRKELFVETETTEIPCGAASVVILKAGEVLVVAKSKKFQLIGGKTKISESPQETAVRETREESGLSLDPSLLQPVVKMKFTKGDQTLYHHFFLYNLEGAVNPRGPKSLWWRPIWRLRKSKLFTWWGYATAVRAAIHKVIATAQTSV